MMQSCAPDEMLPMLPMAFAAPRVPAPCEVDFGHGCRARAGLSERPRLPRAGGAVLGRGGVTTGLFCFASLLFALLSFAVAPVPRAPLREPP